MTKKAQKRNLIALAAAVILSAVMLTGCGAAVTVYDYTEDGARINAVEVELDGQTLARMERTAADGEHGRWTVSTYLYELFTDYGYTLDDAQTTGGGYRVRYVKSFDGETDLDKLGTAIEYSYSYTDNPFTRKVVKTSPNPFNGVRRAFDDPDRQTALYTVKNGTVAVDEYGEQVVLFPAITDAFPALRGQSADGLRLDYVVGGSSRMKSTGTSDKSGRNTNYTFSRYFDDTETEIGFSYDRPVPYGWYLAALAAGAVTTGIIVLVAYLKKKNRNKQPPETLMDRFPYNPEEYRSYENLPTAHRGYNDD